MASKEKQYESLAKFIEKNGEVIDSCRAESRDDEDEYDLVLMNHADLWLLITSFEDGDEYKLLNDEESARAEFAKAKVEMER